MTAQTITAPSNNFRLKVRTLRCVDCHEEFTTTGTRSVRCVACQKTYAREQERARYVKKGMPRPCQHIDLYRQVYESIPQGGISKTEIARRLQIASYSQLDGTLATLEYQGLLLYEDEKTRKLYRFER